MVTVFQAGPPALAWLAPVRTDPMMNSRGLSSLPGFSFHSVHEVLSVYSIYGLASYQGQHHRISPAYRYIFLSRLPVIWLFSLGVDGSLGIASWLSMSQLGSLSFVSLGAPVVSRPSSTGFVSYLSMRQSLHAQDHIGFRFCGQMTGASCCFCQLFILIDLRSRLGR